MAGLMESWYLLRKTTMYTEAAILRGMLEENQIPVMVVNKQDSSYVFLGEIEVYVPVHLKDLARSLTEGTITN